MVWNQEALFDKLQKAAPEIRGHLMLTLVLEELIHRAHDLVDPFNLLRSGVRWNRLKSDPIRQLVRGAYQSATDFRNLGEEYLRMVVQVRNGFPLTEEFYRDTKALREALMRPQSAEVEAAVKRVSEMLFHGRASEVQRRPASGDPDDALFAEQLPEADAGDMADAKGAGNENDQPRRAWGEIAPGDQGATVEVRRPGEAATRSGVATRITGKAVVIQPAKGKSFGVRPEEVRVIGARRNEPGKEPAQRPRTLHEARPGAPSTSRDSKVAMGARESQRARHEDWHRSRSDGISKDGLHDGAPHDSGNGDGQIDQAKGAKRIAGKSYDTKKLKRLGSFLARRGVILKVGDGHVKEAGIGWGGFSLDGTELILSSDPTQYETWHELAHFMHCKKIGQKAYEKLPRTKQQNVPEQFVFNFLRNSKKRWDALSSEQKQHAIDYIEKHGGIL